MSDLKRVYSEIYQILLYLGDEYINKIPEKFLDLIAKERDKKYKPNIVPNIPLENQELLEDTINILALLCMDYWYTEEEKNNLKELLTINEQNYQNILREKYNPDDIFKKKDFNKNILNETKENMQMVEYKEQRWYKKILEKIWKIFKIRKKQI